MANNNIEDDDPPPLFSESEDEIEDTTTKSGKKQQEAKGPHPLTKPVFDILYGALTDKAKMDLLCKKRSTLSSDQMKAQRIKNKVIIPPEGKIFDGYVSLLLLFAFHKMLHYIYT